MMKRPRLTPMSRGRFVPQTVTRLIDTKGALTPITFGSTSKEIDSAQAETKKLRERIESLEARVVGKASPADTELRTELEVIRKQIEGVDARL